MYRVPLFVLIAATALGAQSPRPMTFLDVQNMRQVSGQDLSPDGKSMVYSLSTPDWNQARRQSDIYVVSIERGLASTRQLTFTADKNETSPHWSRDGAFIGFLSDRDAIPAAGAAGAGRGGAAAGAAGGSRNQLFVMRIDGGEARRVTDARDGVASFSFSKDGRSIVFVSGRPGSEQLNLLNMSDLDRNQIGVPKPIQLTRHATGIGTWQWSPDGKRIYFAAPDSIDRDDRVRSEKQFTVKPRNPASSLASLWMFDFDTKQERRLTNDSSYSVGEFTISPDGKWIAFHGMSPNRYERSILEQNDYADLYLLNAGSEQIARLTKNDIIAESPVSFSPDSKLLAFSAPDDFKFMHNERIYVRPVDQPNAPLRKLGGNFDGDVRIGRGFGGGDLESSFWSAKDDTIYVGTGVRATTQIFAVSVATGQAKQLTDVKGTVSLSRDGETGRILITYADPKTPPATYTVAAAGDLADRAKWTQLTEPNAWVGQQIALGDEEEITWKSSDGTKVSGVLVKPVGYQPGKRYPLIVAIHGGPAAADMLSFNGGYNSQVYAGAGYVVLQPNYRQSTQYGEKFKIESQGDYFTKGFQDIMAGVDFLISQGMVDSTQMGALGWSAGGHYSNWIEGHTNRFKAISSGAGVANWISMWSQSDTQRLRQWYLGDKMYWEPGQLENWWKQSPIAYIKNAKTPMFIHVVDGDPRVPRPQSEEMHMALSKLGVPNEFWVYPGTTHGIPDVRNQYLKAVAEMAWMDYYVRGSGKKFAWRDVLKSVETGGPQLAGEAVP